MSVAAAVGGTAVIPTVKSGQVRWSTPTTSNPSCLGFRSPHLVGIVVTGVLVTYPFNPVNDLARARDASTDRALPAIFTVDFTGLLPSTAARARPLGLPVRLLRRQQQRRRTAVLTGSPSIRPASLHCCVPDPGCSSPTATTAGCCRSVPDELPDSGPQSAACRQYWRVDQGSDTPVRDRGRFKAGGGARLVWSRTCQAMFRI